MSADLGEGARRILCHSDVAPHARGDNDRPTSVLPPSIAAGVAAAHPFVSACRSLLARAPQSRPYRSTAQQSNWNAVRSTSSPASRRDPASLSDHADYNRARAIWNGMHDKRPALIAQCKSADDVRDAVTFASQHKLLVAVRGGGHSWPGKSVCEGGLMIDLRQ